ncbi:MAG: SRPBCC family protein [Chitinophagaceae bacterium]|nr:SRPBCC family protein [Chitinophagaceae bacterium]
MPNIELQTIIHAPIERCFDLARSIDLHKLSTGGTNEEAIAGVTTGLISGGEEVTWRAKHFGITQTLSSRITAFERPYYFRDEMIKGAFKMIRHDHIFEEKQGYTLMSDKFRFESPGWIFGDIFNTLVLKKYLGSLLKKRNNIIKQVAETDQWKEILTVRQ